MRRRGLLAAGTLSIALAQIQKKEPEGPWAYTHAPDLANVRYGPHERHVLDLWKAQSNRPAPLMVYLHPGAFAVGDKTWIERYDKDLREICLERSISVASANYRYSRQATYPAPMHDGARAVQFLRSHAREWNIDAGKLLASGGSSGAVIALWLAFHDDLANPRSGDPVERESTRVRAAGVIDAQATFDPREIASVIDAKTAQIPPIAAFYGLKPGTDLVNAESKFALYDDASPAHNLNAGDPPAFLYYTTPHRELPATPNGESIHNPRFGYFLKQRMDKLGIECIVKIAADYPGDSRRRMSLEMVDFFQRHLQ
jgi:predicted DNA-binding transcriptional regulator AlpA